MEEEIFWETLRSNRLPLTRADPHCLCCALRLFHWLFYILDSKGNPRCITNSKGKKRRVSSKDLQQAIKTSDANFLDFIRRCLE